MWLPLALLGLSAPLGWAPEPLIVVSGTAAEEVASVDLNRASLAELVALPGVGEKRARDIMEHRLRRPFRRPADLMKVRGFGRRLYFQLKPWIRVERPGASGSRTGGAPDLRR